jgi:hypothetical protein
MTLRVTVEDIENGDRDVGTVPLNDYMVIVHGDCHISNIQTYKSGTHVITIKGRKPAKDAKP